MNPDNTEPHISRTKSLMAIVAGSLLFVLVIVVFNLIGKVLFGSIIASGLRARTTVELTGAMLSEIVVLVLLVLYLKRRGTGLRQLGLWASSPARGWIAAALDFGCAAFVAAAASLRTSPLRSLAFLR